MDPEGRTPAADTEAALDDWVCSFQGPALDCLEADRRNTAVEVQRNPRKRPQDCHVSGVAFVYQVPHPIHY